MIPGKFEKHHRRTQPTHGKSSATLQLQERAMRMSFFEGQKIPFSGYVCGRTESFSSRQTRMTYASDVTACVSEKMRGVRDPLLLPVRVPKSAADDDDHHHHSITTSLYVRVCPLTVSPLIMITPFDDDAA
jgi:hypothetical protein